MATRGERGGLKGASSRRRANSGARWGSLSPKSHPGRRGCECGELHPQRPAGITWARCRGHCSKPSAVDVAPRAPTLKPMAGAELKNDVLSRAFPEARALNHYWVGTEHLLLALVRPVSPEPSLAIRALRSCGLNEDAIRAQVLKQVPKCEPGDPRLERRPPTNWDGVRLTPQAYKVFGFASGLAAATGVEEGDEHLLIALLWFPQAVATTACRMLGAEPAQILAALKALGVRVPEGEPPPRDDTRWGEPVVVKLDDLARLLERLPLLLDAQGAPLSFNFDEEKAWVRSREDVDLEALVQEALEDAP